MNFSEIGYTYRLSQLSGSIIQAGLSFIFVEIIKYRRGYFEKEIKESNDLY